MNLISVSELKRQRFREASGETLKDTILTRIKDLEADYRYETIPRRKLSIMEALRMNCRLIYGPEYIYEWKG